MWKVLLSEKLNRMIKYRQNTLKAISDLLPVRFSIDLSQTPYTWDYKEITEFLAEIALGEPGIDGLYILARIIVKKQINNNGQPEWKLVDGVQRLTTLLILLLYLEKERFYIRYCNINSTSYFLECINELKGQQDWEEIFKDKREFKNDENFYFYYAYLRIENWFLNSCCDIKLFYDKLMKTMKILWIEVPEDLAGRVTPLHLAVKGIPLTDSERHKGLFLNQ
jgi:uncharacterized protein with ParB-like and HNH nuclease domain